MKYIIFVSFVVLSINSYAQELNIGTELQIRALYEARAERAADLALPTSIPILSPEQQERQDTPDALYEIKEASDSGSTEI